MTPPPKVFTNKIWVYDLQLVGRDIETAKIKAYIRGHFHPYCQTSYILPLFLEDILLQNTLICMVDNEKKDWGTQT